MSASLPLFIPSTRRAQSGAWFSFMLRALGVLLLSASVHVLTLLWAQREMSDIWNTLPPAAPTVDVQLFVPPAPVVLGKHAQPARRAAAVQKAAVVTPQGSDSALTSAQAPTSTESSESSAEPALEPEPVPEPVPEPAPEPTPAPTPTPSPVDNAVVTFPKLGRMVYTTYGGSGILRIETETVTEWRVTPEHYESRSETRTSDGEVMLLLTSTGQVRAESGIAPQRYTEKSRRRAELAANFVPEEKQITFSSTSTPAPLVDGTQDRLSFQAQLALLAQAFPDRFQPGQVIAMNVAGTRDVRVYDFRVSGWESVRVEDGKIYDTLKLDRPMNPERPDVRVEIWLAPKLKWLPARVRLTFANGNFGDSVLREVKFDED